MSLKKLNPSLVGQDAKDFERGLSELIIGQDRAVRTMARIYQTWRAGFTPPDRTIANMLFLGPTGSGKTRFVEAVAEVLHGNPKAMVKIDCAEYQSDHEVAKILGSPPGYVGNEIKPVLSNEEILSHQTADAKLTPVLFDEIEKAAPALWQLLLGIMDKATLKDGKNERVDFTSCVIYMTSNLASREVKNLITGGLGFNSGPVESGKQIDEKIYRTAVQAASRHFSAEFMNRLDRTIVFHSLTAEHLEKILDVELGRLQDRITVQAAVNNTPFVFHCTSAARMFLIQEGTDTKSGARQLKRVIERYVTGPLANMVATDQIWIADEVIIDHEDGNKELEFYVSNPEKGLLWKPGIEKGN